MFETDFEFPRTGGWTNGRTDGHSEYKGEFWAMRIFKSMIETVTKVTKMTNIVIQLRFIYSRVGI